MSKISTYEVVPVPKLADKLIGTSVGGEIEDATYNFTLQELLELFLPNIPANNLQGVLDYGNTATQDINLFGTITTTNLDVTGTANLFITYLNEETHIVGGVYDSEDSIGTSGQVLTSTGEGVAWVTLPPIFTPNLQQVLTEGNTSTIGIVLDATLEALTVDTDDAVINDNITIDGTITDGNAEVGTPGQVLSSTSTGVEWVDLPAYSAVSPLLFNSVTGVFSIQQASNVQGGYLSASDWVTFDGKQNAGNYITALTGEASASGPGAASTTLSNAAVIAKVLTGFNPTAGTINASDSILTAFGKTQSQINALVGGVQYKGTWNASTNVPTLQSSVGVQGNYYIVSVAGNTNLNGITDWQVGDWAIFSETTWQKVDNTESVTSVNGFTGAVSLTTDNIPEGSTNLYYLDSRARGALSFAAGSGAYNNVTGVITIPTNNNQILNGAGYITLASLSASAPLSYNNLTGGFAIQKSDATHDGYLSSTDWSTFNNKQNYLGGTGLVKSTAGTISYITDNSGNWNTAYDRSIVSAAVTGTSTKTLTLTEQDGNTIQASWTDLDTGLTSVGVSMPSAFTVTNSPLTANGTIAVTGAGTSLQYIDGTGALQTFPGLTGFVPYTGANQNVDLGEYGISAGYFQADLTPSGALQVGRMQWNATDGTMDLRLLGNNVTLQIGEENVSRVVNKSGIDLLEANYQVVRLRKVAEGGAQGQRIAVVLAQGNNENNSTEVLGLVTETILANQEGFITCFGEVKEINTTGSLQGETWVDGDILYLSATVAGQLTNIRPIAPNHAVIVGYVSYAHAVHGKIYLAIDTGYELGELHNVYAPSPTANQSIYWNATNSRYELNTIGGILGYTPADDSLVVHLAGTETITGQKTFSSAIKSDGSILLKNGIQSILSGYVDIAGNTYGKGIDISFYDLAGTSPLTQNLFFSPTASYSYTFPAASGTIALVGGAGVGTVTSVAALTLGTSGTDLSSTVANPTTTPVITLNVPTASAANRGALSAADWSTFNTKVGSVTASSPLASSGGQTPNITIQQASGSQDGYLSSTDWTTFNNKQASGNYITSLTGEATASGPGAAAVTLNNASVTAKVLTGVNITGGTIQATDTMLTAFGKLQNQINGLVGGSIYQGTWNASTNTPALASGIGTKGYYYIVSVAGSTNLDGITDWNIGDWAIFDGTAWQQVDNTDAVVSVNGQTGAVSLTTDNIPEGATNLYFTNVRARASLSFAAGSGAYNSTTGVITIPTNTNQLTNGASFITLASLSGTAPIVYSNTTGVISITQAGTASNGYLSSTDWNTFNNKQGALTLTTTGTSGAATLVGNTLNIPQYQSVITNPVTGTGTAGQVAFFNSASSIASESNFLWDTSLNKLTVTNGTVSFGGLQQDAGQVLMTLSANNAAGQAKNLYVTLIAGGTPEWQITTGAVSTDAGIKIIPNGSNGLTVPFGTTAASFSNSLTVGDDLTVTDKVGIGGAVGTEQLFVYNSMAKSPSSSGWGVVVQDTNNDGLAGRGGAIAFGAYRTDNARFNVAAVAGAKSNSTGTNENGDLVLYSSVSSALTERQRIASNGAIRFNAYGSGSFTGTPTYRLAVDSVGNIIEVTDGGGTITGGGTSGQVTYWNGSSNVTGSTTFTFSPNGQFYVAPTNTAGAGTAFGMDLNPTLVAAANGNTLASLLIRGTFTNGAFTGVQNYLIIAERSNNRWFRYDQEGWFKKNDNAHATALVLENTYGSGYGVAMNLTLGYGGDSTNVGTAITGARIEANPEGSWSSTASTQDASLLLQTANNGVLGTGLTITSGKTIKLNGYTSNGFVKTSGGDGTLTIDTTTNYITGSGSSNEVAIFSTSNSISGATGFYWQSPTATVGISASGNNTDYQLRVLRHGDISNPGTGTATPGLYIIDYAADGPATYSNLGLVEITYPRINSTDTNAANASLLRLSLDDMVALQVSAKGRTFIGQSSATDNGQILQVSGTSRFDGVGTFTSTLIAGGDLQLIGSNPRIDYPSGSSLRLYQTGVGTKLEISSAGQVSVTNDAAVLGKMGIGGQPEAGITLTLKGNGVDSPLLKMIGFANTTAMIGDTTTGTTDVGNLWLYNDGTLRIRLDADTAGTSYINAAKFVVGATSSSNALFRVTTSSNDATYDQKLQAVFGPVDYQDSDSANLYGAGASETQFTNGATNRPAVISLGGTLNAAETVGVINFFRSGNDNGYRSRAIIAGVVTDGGTVNRHGAYLSFRTAGNDDLNPIEVVRIAQFQNVELKWRESIGNRYGFLYSKEALHLTNNSYYSSAWLMAQTGPASQFVADSDGSLLLRVAPSNTENNATSWQTKVRVWGTDRSNLAVGLSSALADAANRGNITINGSNNSILAFGAGGVLKGYLYNNGSNFYMNYSAGSYFFESDSATTMTLTTGGFVGIRRTPNVQFDVNGSTNGINLETNVTAANAVTPYFTILETGVSRTVTGYTYGTSQPLAMVITQTAGTTFGLYRASEDTVGSTLRGMKSRGTAAAPASVANGDDVFSVEGWAWHGSGPNLPKLGAGMKFVKDDNWGTANAYAPQRTEFYNANSTTTVITTMIIYPSGNITVTGSVTATGFFESSDSRLKTLINENYKVKGIGDIKAKLYIKNGKEELGYFAQDVQDILPSAVTKGADGLLNLSYREVHTAKIARLEKRVEELEAQLNSK